MNYILFDTERRLDFLPLTHTRPMAEIRCGINTIAEKWKHYLQTEVSYKTELYLQQKYKLHIEDVNIFIDSSIIPTDTLVHAIRSLHINEYLLYNKKCIACCITKENAETFVENEIPNTSTCIEYKDVIDCLHNITDIFSKNEQEIKHDVAYICKGRKSQPCSATNTIIGNTELLFIEEGATVECAILNTTNGPIYIGKHAEIMEGSIVRGPFAMGENAQLKMGTKIYGATTIGIGCKVGGEVNNSVFFANSSKAHDGFIGNSIIGEWCNIGADSNNSNLKNNYEEVKLWSEHSNKFEKTGLQFCGLVLADHSKCGINTMFNTGTVVGVSSNIFGAGFPRNFIPSFSWGGAQGFTEYTLAKSIATAEKVFARRKIEFDEVEKNIFTHVFDITKGQR